MNDTRNTTARRCEFCGEPLKVIPIELFGQVHMATCYGSCGCERSQEKLESFGPQGRAYEPSMRRCPQCGGTMQLDLATRRISDCPWCGYSCVFKSDLDSWAEGRRAERAEAAGGVLAGTGFGEMFWSAEPDYARADAIARTGKGLFITGGSGTAKTLMAASVAKVFAERGKAVRYVSSTQILSAIRDTYGGAGTEGEVFDELNGCDLLVLDDLGKEGDTSWAQSMLYTVIDGRYANGKPIIVTTNYTEPELVGKMADEYDDRTAEAIMSRLIEMTEKVVLDGPDRRLTA